MVLMIAAAGCSATPRTDATGAGPELHAAIWTAGASVEGRPIEVRRLGHGPDLTLILATIHGDEAAGTPLCGRLLDHLAGRPGALEGRAVLVVPVANPDGHVAGRRTNARGVDLNRNFDAVNRRELRRHGPAALSEPESRAIAALIERHRPNRIVSIHQPLACVDYDGPAAALAQRMAEACGLPVRKLGSRPGSLGAWAGEDLGIPTITLELPGGASKLAPEALWERYGEALLLAIGWGGGMS